MRTFIIILIFIYLDLNASAQKSNDSIIATFEGVSKGKLLKSDIGDNDSIVLFYNKASLSNSKVLSFMMYSGFHGNDIWCTSNSNKIGKHSCYIDKLEIGEKFYIDNIKIKINNDIITLTKGIEIEIDGFQACIFKEPKYFTNTIYLNLDSLSPRPVGTCILSGIGYIPKKDFLMNDYLFVEYPTTFLNNGIDKFMQIIKYTCYIYYDNNYECNDSINVTGDKITEEIKKIAKSKKVSQIKFDGITAKTWDGKLIDVASLYLNFWYDIYDCK